MKISVVIGTYRLGGIDVLLGGLKNQTLDDFELVLVDSLYNGRKQVVLDYARKLGIDDKLVHIPPPPGNALPYRHIVPALNHGISKASGELLVFWSDFCYPRRSSLQKHWELYLRSAGKTTVTGSYDFVSHPPLHPTAAAHLNGRTGMAEYLSLVESHSRELGITIFSKEFASGDIASLKVTSNLAGGRYSREIDYRGIHTGELAPWYLWVSKNYSIPRELFHAVGIFDSDLGGWHDEFDLGLRLARVGHRMVYDPSNRVYVMNLVDLFPSTITNLDRLASHETMVRKRIGHGQIRFKATLSFTDLVKLRLRLLLLSPAVANSLKDTWLEKFMIGMIYAFSLGEPEFRYVNDGAWKARF